MVGTTNRSLAAMSGAWLRKKVRHPWLGGPRRLTMYLADARLRDFKPELEQFAVNAWRTPKRVLHAHPPDQYAQFRVDLRSPSQSARLPTPVPAKAGPMPTHQRLGSDDCENLQDRRKPAIQLDKEPAIIVCEPDATMQPTLQDNQLMPKHRVLGFKPQLRLEWRGQDGQNETKQPDHSASLGDFFTSSTRIRFSVHTPNNHRSNLRYSSSWAAPNASPFAATRVVQSCLVNPVLLVEDASRVDDDGMTGHGLGAAHGDHHVGAVFLVGWLLQERA